MFELKPLSRQAIPGALEKAHRYRLLNEPAEAESICRDVLEIDPGNQQALIALVLALSDQLDHRPGAALEARECLEQVQDEYARLYYGGILIERRAKATLNAGTSTKASPSSISSVAAYSGSVQAIRKTAGAGRCWR